MVGEGCETGPLLDDGSGGGAAGVDWVAGAVAEELDCVVDVGAADCGEPESPKQPANCAPAASTDAMAPKHSV